MTLTRKPGAFFSKVPKLFGRISGDIILFVSSKLRRLEARNFAVIFIFIPFTTYEKTSFTEYTGRSFTNGFSGPKSFREFRETAPRFGKKHFTKNYLLEKGKLTQNLVLFQVVHDLIDRSNLNFKASELILNHHKK